jgi:hypothetical protein
MGRGNNGEIDFPIKSEHLVWQIIIKISHSTLGRIDFFFISIMSEDIFNSSDAYTHYAI